MSVRLLVHAVAGILLALVLMDCAVGCADFSCATGERVSLDKDAAGSCSHECPCSTGDTVNLSRPVQPLTLQQRARNAQPAPTLATGFVALPYLPPIAA